MKHYTNKLTALLLAALLMVASVAPYASAEGAVYNTETKYPLLADVRGQLDEDEIIVAWDVIINAGDYFDPADVSAFKVEKTGKPADKVEISFFSARAADGTAFTSTMPGSYSAYYIVRPVSGHPAYEASRRITVKAAEESPVVVPSEADVDVIPEDEPADEDSEDDPYEESETDDSEEDAFDDEGDDEEEYDDTEEFPEEDDSWDDDTEDEDSEWDEDSDWTEIDDF